MNTKEFVTNIIHTSQKKIVQRFRCMPKGMSITIISVLGLLLMTSVPNRGMTAYAQHLQSQPTDPWYQSLEIAHSKVQAALSPGAFGHGVPGLHNMSTNDLLVFLGLTALGFMAVYIAVKVLLRYLNEGKANLAIRCNGKMI
ncbi:MAG: hypothetical protein P0116_14925 [Candidatus Nitrosocosmicus sp.]|nr:hypothetical protein [Candidatus Nitrosocosmicus sp.]